ncbi:hypothetical protein F4808DRAFT_406892 [Astrocystis sublimbata]|nr:hypothetical protein F4808DRAFT_406892 [Astrocystis sublimbata]
MASTEARFSPNVVSLQIRGPGYGDLSFYDLPGLFQVAETKGDDYLVDVVDNLTRKYVGRDGAIIMLALPMDLDLDNSKTLGVIRQLNAESRTIGVLTKADRPDFNRQDTIAYWLSVLDEKKQRVKEEGFYVTSLPPESRNLSAWEETFFRAGIGSRWPRSFDRFSARFGVDQLRCHITKALGDAFASSLPDIKQKFRRCLEQTGEDLDKLPELPSNVEHQVRMSLRDFYTSARRAVDNGDFEQNCKELTEGFFDCLVQMKPRITNAQKPRPRLPVEEIVVVSDDSELEIIGTKRGPPKGSTADPVTRKRRTDLLSTPVKTEEYFTQATFQSPATPTLSVLNNPNRVHFQGLLKEKGTIFRLSLQDIHKQIKLKTRGGFSDVVPFEVHEDLCLRAVSQWESPLNLYINKALAMLTSTVVEALERSLQQFSTRLIYKESYEFLMAFLKAEGAHQQRRLEGLLKNETYKAVTINESGLNFFETQEKKLIEGYRLFTRIKAAGLIDEDQNFKRDTQMSREEMQEQNELLDKHRAHFPEDEYQREVDVAAKVRAYYMTAATRFVDGASMDLNSRLFRKFSDGALDYYLDDKLGLSSYTSGTDYDQLMEEDTATAQRRQQLRKDREKVKAALDRVVALETSPTRQQDRQQPATRFDAFSGNDGTMEI